VNNITPTHRVRGCDHFARTSQGNFDTPNASIGARKTRGVHTAGFASLSWFFLKRAGSAERDEGEEGQQGETLAGVVQLEHRKVEHRYNLLSRGVMC